MLKGNRGNGVALFLLGLGSMTEIHFLGSVALSELYILLFGPVLFFKDFKAIKKDGFLPFTTLTMLTCLGCLVAGYANDTYWLLFAKGMAVPVVYFLATVVFYHYLRADLSAMRWFIIGVFISSIINIFIFQQETYTFKDGQSVTGQEAVAAVTGSAVFLSSRINAALQLPIKCFYLHVPLLYSFSVPIMGAIIALFFSDASGRAGAAVAIVSSLLILIVGKSRKAAIKIGRHLIVLLILLAALAWGIKTTYAQLAKGGILGYVAQQKYMKQTSTGTGLLNILMAGRMELFCAIFACCDRPIVGWGPKPEDRGGYVENYLARYGTQEDYETYLKSIENDARYGYRFRAIPSHSHIAGFWLYYGVFGLLLWLYVFWLMFKYMRSYAASIPQWMGYMFLSIPSMVWAILFSPPGGRLQDVFFIVCLLFCKAVYERRVTLPISMEMEIDRASR